MTKTDAWALMLGYHNVSLQAKVLYWHLDKIADEKDIVETTSAVLAKLLEKSEESIGQYLRILRQANLLKTITIGKGRNLSKYLLIKPSPKNRDYIQSCAVLKDATLYRDNKKTTEKKEKTTRQSQPLERESIPSVPSPPSPSSKEEGGRTNTLAVKKIKEGTITSLDDFLFKGAGLAKDDTIWLKHQIGEDGLKRFIQYIEEDPSKRAKSAVGQWSVWNFIDFIRWLYTRTFSKPCLALSFSKQTREDEDSAGGRILLKIRSGLMRRFDEHGMTKAHIIAYLVWLFGEKGDAIREIKSLVGVIVSGSFQQEWIEGWLPKDEVVGEELPPQTIDTLYCVHPEEYTTRPWKLYYDPESQPCMICPHELICRKKNDGD